MACSGLQLDHHLKFNQGVARKSGHADGGAHVAARFPEQFHEEIRRSVAT
jgi:hypothetical protein